jgi:radical SAM protein
MGQVDFDLAPFTVVWEVTRACALACIHCRAEAQPRRHPLELTTAEGFALLDQIKEFGNPIFVITGGDPMMRKDLYDLIGYATSKGLRVSLTPSATRIVTLQRLQRAKEAGVRRIAISLDGPTPEVHDAFRGFAGSFERTLEILGDAQKVELPLQVNTTVSRHNLDFIDQMPPLVSDFGAVQWSVFFLVPTGRGKVEDLISAEDQEKLLHWLYELSETAPFDIKATACPLYRRVIIQAKKNKTKVDKVEKVGGNRVALMGAGYQYQDGLNRPAISKGVNDGKGFCFISHIGEVCPSGFLPIPAGNIRKQSLAEIYRHSPLFKDLRDAAKLKGKCGKCEFREICGGSRARAYALTGDYLAEDPTCIYQPKNSQ